ncbi:hypothetical protein K438DRAFT_1757084 [Mycena galopus ATCC 62051]|nr:hypothetical protein K438DRAFT_1757084 [Mycena galopus ATCC 62051]
MPGIEVLVPDLLSEIMFQLPPDIHQKFAFSQVSRYLRDVAIHNHLYWSSFTGGESKADCTRVPLALERSGSSMLHIRLYFASGHMPEWHADVLEALIPYVARIHALDVKLWVYSTYSLSPKTVEALLNANLEFSALHTLRLEGPEYGCPPLLLLTAPRLRTLDIERFYPSNWGSLLSASLENIRLHHVRSVSLQTLVDIFERCPSAWHVALDYDGLAYDSSYGEDFFRAFTRRPLAPALRELELGTPNPDLGRILKAGFSDVVLPTLTGCLYNSDMDVLAEALLPGVGSLVGFELASGMQQLELRDDNGHLRRFQCWNEDSFEVDRVWEYLSIHYNLHKTVREIRIAHWDDFAEIFQQYTAQLPDGITLVYSAPWDDMHYSIAIGEEEDYITRTMCIPGLAKVEFSAHSDRPRSLDYTDLWFATILKALAHIELPIMRKIEVCIRNPKLFATGMETEFGAFQTALRGAGGGFWETSGRILSRNGEGDKTKNMRGARKSTKVEAS